MIKIYFIILNLIFGQQFINADISHLTNGLLQRFHNLYGPPPPVLPVLPTPLPTPPIINFPLPVEPFIPEIIVNRQAQGYDYNPPPPLPTPIDHNYLPPQSDYGPPVQQRPDLSPPPPPSVQQDQFLPPNDNYLPIGQTDLIISYENNSNGYDYNVPSTSTIGPSIIFPQPAPEADAPVDFFPEEPVKPPQIDQGYNYDSPSTTPPPPSIYLPPVAFVRSAKDFDQFSGAQQQSPIHLNMKEMRCLNSRRGYFRAAFRIDTLTNTAHPVIDSESINDPKCQFKIVQSLVLINIAGEDFQRCGIRYCDQNLCLRIRFPQIIGMKTGSDAILTLQCKIQERIVSKLHALKMGISNEIQARSLGAQAHGGSQQPFRTHIELLRKSPNGFTRHVQPKGTVQLGEELMLRAHVYAGDGWNHTKLTDVNLQRISTNGEIINTVNLVTAAGCINPKMRSICPIPPSFEPPLGHRLMFKAVMFHGMKSGDELMMSIRIAGCLDHADCFVNTQNCRSERFKRSSTTGAVNDISKISTISFRVEIPHNINSDDEMTKRGNSDIWIIAGGITLLIFIIISIFIILYLQFKSIFN